MISGRSQAAPIRGALRVSLAGLVLAGSSLLGAVPAVHAQGGRAALPEAAGTSFNSSFGTNANGWSPLSGKWSVTPAGFYQTSGLASAWSSSKHTGTYRNFVYVVKMRRPTGCCGATGIILRGSPLPLDGTNHWDDAYYFSYSNDGNVRVERVDSGVWDTLMDWTPSPAVALFGWNTLRVIADGSIVAFYLNGTLIYYGGDPTPILAGSVAFGMYGGGGGDKLQVDWAKLSVIPY